VNVTPVVEFRGASVGAHLAPAPALIDGMDWTVQPGDCWIVSGFQGSGKSVLLETIAGLQSLRSGTLEVLGTTLSSRGMGRLTEWRRKIGMVFDGTGRLFPNLTLFENISLPLRYHRNLSLETAANELAPLLRALELDGAVAALHPRRAGRGLARRAALARALALKPELLLLDNPLGGLDATQSRFLRGFLGQLRLGHPWLEGVRPTLIVGVESLRSVLGVGHQFAIVHERRWQVIGDRDAVLQSINPVVQELVADANSPVESGNPVPAI